MLAATPVRFLRRSQGRPEPPAIPGRIKAPRKRTDHGQHESTSGGRGHLSAQNECRGGYDVRGESQDGLPADPPDRDAARPQTQGLADRIVAPGGDLDCDFGAPRLGLGRGWNRKRPEFLRYEGPTRVSSRTSTPRISRSSASLGIASHTAGGKAATATSAGSSSTSASTTRATGPTSSLSQPRRPRPDRRSWSGVCPGSDGGASELVDR